MKKKICFLINKNFLQFGIAKYFQSNNDFELYALIDDDPNLKNFFEKQDFQQRTVVFITEKKILLNLKKPFFLTTSLLIKNLIWII